MYAEGRNSIPSGPPYELPQDHDSNAEEEVGSIRSEVKPEEGNTIISEDMSSSESLEEEGGEASEAGVHDGTYEYGYRHPPGARGGAHRHDYGYMNHIYGGSFNDSEYVMVDAHVLASPVLADINGDGDMEVSHQIYA